MKIIGLVPQGQGTNKVFQSCCPTKLRLLVELQPGEPNHNIHRVLWTDPSCGSTIVSVGNNPYANPLSTNYLLTQGVQMEIEIDICPCEGVGVIKTYQLRIETQSPNATHDFYFDFEGVDITTYDLIDKSSAYFFDCLNDCGRIQTLFTITNPSPIEMPIDIVDLTLCGFQFWYNLNDGNGFVNGKIFNINGNSTAEFAVSNPGCLVTTECDFSLDVRICNALITETIPVTHEQVDCGDCGIHCDSIQILNAGQYGSVIPNPNFSDGTEWNITDAYFGNSHSVGFGYLQLIENTAGYNDWRIDSNQPFNWPLGTYTVYYELEIRTGVIDSTVNSLTFYSGASANAFTILNNITSNQTYIVHFTDASFVAPSLITGNTGSLQFLCTPGVTGRNNFINYYDLRISFLPIASIDLDCSNLDAYNETAIGDRKYASFKLFYEKGFKAGTQIYFNPFMFSANGCDTSVFSTAANSIPSAGWMLTVPAVPTLQIATLYNNNNNQIIGNIKNYGCNVYINNDYEFIVEFQFFILQDTNNWLGYSNPNNRDAFLKNSSNNPTLLDNIGGNSVYNYIKQFCALIKIIDPSIVTGQNPNGTDLYYECQTIKSVFFNCRFWNLGLNNNPSEMHNPTWTLERNSVQYNDISTVNPTDVTFTLDYGVSIDTAVVYVFDASGNDNSINFLQNYNTIPATIFTTIAAPGTTIGGVVESPTQDFTNIGGNTYELKFRISNNLNPGGDYYIGIVAYSNTDMMVNSFLKKVDVKTTPDVGDLCCAPIMLTTFYAYNHTPSMAYGTQGFTPTMDERIGLRTYIEPGAIETCLQNYGFDPFTDNWLNYLKTVTMRIYKRTTDNVAFLGNTYTYYMMREFTLTRDQFGNYASSDPVYFSGSESGFALTTFCYQRVASYNGVFDASKVYTSTLTEAFNRSQWNPVAAATLIANNNMTWSWADQDVFFEQEFSFDFQGIFPTSVPFKLYNLVVAHAIDYETNPQPFTQKMNPLEVYGVNNAGTTLLTNPVICNNSYDHLLIKASLLNPSDTGYLIALFNDANGSQFTLKEYESYPYNYLPQKTESPLYDVDTAFVGGEAFFKVDLQGLPAGTYKICAIKSPS